MRSTIPFPNPTESRRRSARSNGPATMSFWSWRLPSGSTGETRDAEEEEELEVAEEPKRSFETTGKIKFTSQDHRFLRALKIAVDEENR